MERFVGVVVALERANADLVLDGLIECLQG